MAQCTVSYSDRTTLGNSNETRDGYGNRDVPVVIVSNGTGSERVRVRVRVDYPTEFVVWNTEKTTGVSIESTISLQSVDGLEDREPTCSVSSLCE